MKRLRLNEESSVLPLKHAKKLIDPKLGQYRFRVGNYWIVFDLMGNDIVMLRIAH